MDLTSLLALAHTHCRFRLRSGREVFGVIWKQNNDHGQHLFFATNSDYERSLHGQPLHAVAMDPQEFVYGERLTS